MILAVDQGTSSTKAVLVGADGVVVARGRAAVSCAYPQPGWVEQDADEIWLSVLTAVAQCLAQAPDAHPAALALSNQRESAVVWRRDGTPAGPLIGWQDARTEPACARLRAAGAAPLVESSTGLALDPMFSATKLRWLLDRTDDSDVMAGTVDAFLVYRLTGGAVFAAEAGNASRTQLMSLHTLDWDPEMLDLFGVPAEVLAPIRRSDGGFGVTDALGALPGGLPIAAVLADSHAALYGHGGFAGGIGKATYGTGSSVMTPRAGLGEPNGGVAQTLAWLTERPTYADEGNILASGAALDWMAQTLGLDGSAALEPLAARVDDAAGAHLVPAFTGLGAPYWDRDASGILTGLTAGTRREHLARAALEAVAHQVCDVVEATDVRLETLCADGGATTSHLLMQIQSDLLGHPVLARTTAEMSALGAAHMAGAAIGIWSGESGLAHLDRPAREFHPAVNNDERRRRREAWQDAVRRSRSPVITPELEESLR